MPTGDVTARGPESDWANIIFGANKVKNLSDVKEVSVALRTFLKQNEQNLTIDQLDSLSAVCKNLKAKAIDKKSASVAQKIFKTEKTVEKNIITLESTITQIKGKKSQEISNQIDEKIKSGDFEGAFKVFNESKTYLNPTDRDRYYNKIKENVFNQIDEKIKSGDFEGAIEVLFESKKHLNPTDHDRYYNKIKENASNQIDEKIKGGDFKGADRVLDNVFSFLSPQDRENFIEKIKQNASTIINDKIKSGDFEGAGRILDKVSGYLGSDRDKFFETIKQNASTIINDKIKSGDLDGAFEVLDKVKKGIGEQQYANFLHSIVSNTINSKDINKAFSVLEKGRNDLPDLYYDILRDRITKIVSYQIDEQIKRGGFEGAFQALDDVKAHLTGMEYEVFFKNIVFEQIDTKIESKDFQEARKLLNNTKERLTQREYNAFDKQIQLGQQLQQAVGEIAANQGLQLPEVTVSSFKKAFNENRLEDAKNILWNIVHIQSDEDKVKIQSTMPEVYSLYSSARKSVVDVALDAIVQPAHLKRNLVCQNAKMKPDDYAKYEKFVEEHRSEWAKLGPNDEPISYSHSVTGLTRSVTFVPGKGLMIHMKGHKRGLERQQLGKRGAQGVVTKAVNFDTGAVDAFKSMDVTQFTPMQREISEETLKLHALLKEHPEVFASGRTVQYLRGNKVKIGLFMPMMEGGELLGKVWDGSAREHQVSYSVQMAKSIHQLHSLGYLHRDLKLDNFLVSKDGKTVVLADFDMAIKRDSNSVERGYGNIVHMAPETYGTWLLRNFEELNLTDLTYSQFVDKFCHGRDNYGIDHFFNMLGPPPAPRNVPLFSQFKAKFGDRMTEKSEVFSFGALLYEMKTGQVYQYPGSLRQLDSTNSYDKIILSCLELDPQKRPTMDKVITQLESIEKRM